MSSLFYLEDLMMLEEGFVKKLKTSLLNCKSYVNDNLNVEIMAMTSGFLVGSFPMEP